MSTLSLTMPLKIKPVGSADLECLVQIEAAALMGLEIFRFLCPNGVDASRQESMLPGATRALAYDTTTKYMKVIDTDEEDKILAFAKWQIPGKVLTDLMSTSVYSMTSKSQLTPATMTDGAGGLIEQLSLQASKTRERIMGNEPHCFLNKIATNPNYQCQEAAGILLREMCKAADERKLASYVESSPLGFNLYQKYGFVEVDTINVDLKPWGGMGDYILRNMVRPVLKSE